MPEVFGTLDPFKPQAFRRELVDEFGDRVADAVLAWLARFRPPGSGGR